MHVALISADDETWASGMRSISSTLRKAGHQTTMIFAGSSATPINQSVIEGIAQLAADSEIIGISSMSRGSTRAKTLLKGLRPLGKLLVWGGMHPTLYPEDCAPHADIVCRGEGEEFMLDLVERVGVGRELTDIRNGAYLSDDRLILNDLRPLIPDLDAMPFPDYAFQDEYCLDRWGFFKPNVGMREEERVLFSGSRGCNNSCTYCSNSQLKALYRGNVNYARKMSVSAFIDAAKECRRLFPKMKEFYFTDEDFFARPVEEMRELAESYPSEVGIQFEVMASPRQITEEKVDLAVKAGMWRIDVGLESGSERTRREIFNRHVDDKTQLQAALAIKKHEGVVAYYFLILGNPYEERQDLLDGITLLQKMPSPFFLRAYNLVFIPGTKLFNRACKDGIIHGMNDSAYEMDFLAGFHHMGYEWKRKNLYLDSLISLMIGKSTKLHIGLVPRGLIPFFTCSWVVTFCNGHPRIGERIMNLASLGLRMRHAALDVASKVFRDRRIAYTLILFWNRRRASPWPSIR